MGTWSGCVAAVLLSAAVVLAAANAGSGEPSDQAQDVIDQVERECLKGPNYVYTIGRLRGGRLAEMVRNARPKLVVECGTALGYSGLWIARELMAAGKGGRLITMEIDPKLAERAEANFRKAGLADFVTVKVGDARKLVREVEGPIDFVFLDCGASNYLACLKGLEENLAPGAVIVADNVLVEERASEDYRKYVRGKYKGRTEVYDVNMPWSKRDAMEVSFVTKGERRTGKVQDLLEALEESSLRGSRRVPIIGPEKAERLAELIRLAKPMRVVECGTAEGYSGIWIARELRNAGNGRLITIEIDPKTARRAKANFEKSGLADWIEPKVGDARELVKEIEGPIDFVFLDCGAANYLACLKGLEGRLAPGVVIVADNVLVQARDAKDYVEYVHSKYETRTEEFDVDLPWAKRDTLEVSIVRK